MLFPPPVINIYDLRFFWAGGLCVCMFSTFQFEKGLGNIVR